MQDGNTVTRPRLLNYTKSMLTAMLSNIYTSISLINGVRYQTVGIISDENGMSNFWKVHNLANSCSNLLPNRFKHYFV